MAIGLLFFGLTYYINNLIIFKIISLLARYVNGFGSGMYWISLNSILPLQFPDKVSKVYSIIMSFFGTGRIIGPLIGALLFYYLGYFFMFISISVFILITIPIVYF